MYASTFSVNSLRTEATSSAISCTLDSSILLTSERSFDLTAAGAEMNSAEIEELARQTQEFNDFAAEMNQLMRMFALQMEPVVKKLKEWAQWVQELNQSMGGKLLPIIGLIILSLVAIYTAAVVLAPIITALSTAFALFAPSVAASSAAMVPFVPAVGAAGTAAGAAGTPMLYFAAAALAVGAAFLLVGVGIWIAANGMATFMQSLLLIPPTQLMMYGPALWLFASGISVITLALAGMLPLIPAVAAGMVVFIAAVRSLHWWTSGLDWTFLDPLANMFWSMADALDSPVTNLPKIATAIKDIGKALKTIDNVNAAVAVTKLIQTTSNASKAAAGENTASSLQGKITLEFDPRKAAFEDFVIEIVDNELRTNNLI